MLHVIVIAPNCEIVFMFNPQWLSLKGWCRQLTLISPLNLNDIWNNVQLQKLLETKRLKLFPNVKTKWISMLSFANRILVEYKTLVLKMNDDLKIVVSTSTNLGCLYGIEVVMGLTCIMSMLKVTHALIKFVQGCKTYVCVFVIFVKMCCVKL